ncbi:hypothetical protein GCM10010451_32660 [Streptomyces virens]|uniref:Uncharacterized protein n=1 Tax=Streptomyces virens TaxID=285572 RepID=A0ABP6PKJ6_9ACTN|nr:MULTISPECIES: hypothetical protein [Streptomyces]MBA8975030.1 hypothetical protein [Streptomyces calvus]MYS31615.1 hypothetical protein [Streptomyces sp. SID7804]
MSNRDFGEIVQGPMTPEGPSVDEIRAMRSPTSTFVRRDLRAPMGSAVIKGVPVDGDGTMTEDQADQIRKAAGIGRENHHALKAAESYSDRRDPITGGVIRTWADGRTEIVDESSPAARVRGGR